MRRLLVSFLVLFVLLPCMVQTKTFRIAIMQSKAGEAVENITLGLLKKAGVTEAFNFAY